jgi:hypothetical protein
VREAAGNSGRLALELIGLGPGKVDERSEKEGVTGDGSGTLGGGEDVGAVGVTDDVLDTVLVSDGSVMLITELGDRREAGGEDKAAVVGRMKDVSKDVSRPS